MSCVSEPEAGQRWCPMSRVMQRGVWSSGSSVAAVNRGGHGDAPERITEATRCIGTACMMWRTAFEAVPEQGGPRQPHGYCGLAGRVAD